MNYWDSQKKQFQAERIAFINGLSLGISLAAILFVIIRLVN